MNTVSIPRKVIDQSPEMQFWSITCQVISLSSAFFKTGLAQRTQACAVFCGMGEIWRVKQAIEYAAHSKVPLLIAGTNSEEKTSASLDRYVSESIEGVSSVRILPASEQMNTLVQARWVVEQVNELGLSSLALFVSPYHLPRAYATLLKQMLRVGLRFVIMPVAVVVPPDMQVPESGATAWESGPGEVERYKKYVGQGDLATQIEFEEYFAWLYSNTGLCCLAREEG